MILESLATQNFRNLVSGSIACHPSANFFVGQNGQGKTNVLEAIYVLATTRSFRTAKIQNLARIGSETLFLRGEVGEQSVARSFSVGLASGEKRQRELQINGQRVTLQAYLQTLSVVVYSSARLEIIKGAPEEGRRFLDRGIAGIRNGYLEGLSRYGRVLKQRNALLQKVSAGSARASQLDAWDEELVAAAEPIVKARAEFSQELAREVAEIAAAHRYHVTDMGIGYSPSGFDFTGGNMATNLAQLQKLRSRELRAGFTVIGPHRDALTFSIEGRDASEVLSSGELKMTVLFLKFARIALQQRVTGRSPVFLLDDIDAELDLGVIQRVLAYLASTTQIFVTSAKPTVLADLEIGDNRTFLVQEGSLSPTLLKRLLTTTS